jgi:hypothetical protein
MDAFTQFDVIAKVSPLLASGFSEIVPFFIELRKEGIGSIADVPMQRAAQLFGPVSRELAKMPPEDRRYIMGACLGICERKQDGQQGFAPIWSDQAGRAIFDDINNNISVMLRIAVAVIQGTFADFFPASLSGLLGGAPLTTSK